VQEVKLAANPTPKAMMGEGMIPLKAAFKPTHG
jgi:hypothetical protein